MALHQLFTLAFALQLQPLPTIDYVAAHYDEGQGPSTDAIRVGVNTFLEPFVSRHGPHTVQTLSFLLQYTRALDAVAPWSDLIALLARADDDPKFKNLREFFDARYTSDGKLVGAELVKKPSSPPRRLRSTSRSTALNSSARRDSQVAEARKPSFAQSIGGAAALKLSWLRKNNDSQATGSHGEASDDEDQSSRSFDGSSSRLPVAYNAPELRLFKSVSNGATAEGSAAGQASQAAMDGRASKTVRFSVRLDLHNAGLAPRPARAAISRSRGASFRHSPMMSSDAFSDRAAGRSDGRGSDMHVGHDLTQVVSLTSVKSGGEASSTSQDLEPAEPSQSDVAFPQKAPVDPGSRKNSWTSLPGIGSGKPSRRPSMMSKLLDLGLRKKSGSGQERGDGSSQRQSTSSDDGPGSGSSQSHHRRALPGQSHLRESSNQSGSLNDDEALDTGEDEGADSTDQTGTRTSSSGKPLEAPLTTRRRSSNGSSGRTGLLQNAVSLGPDLGSVREDSALEIDRFPSRSSVDARSVSAQGELQPPNEISEVQARLFANGKDFLTLLRTASELALSLAEASASSVGAAEAVEAADLTPRNESDGAQLSEKARGKRPDVSGASTPNSHGPQVRSKPSSVPSTPSRSIKSLDLDRSPNPFRGNGGRKGQNSSEADGIVETEAWWPCGEVDPLPVAISCALGQALGWEGIMQLCYGPGSRSATEGRYAPFGRAAALEEANKRHERSVLAWRTGVASADSETPTEQNGGPTRPPLDHLAEHLAPLDELSSSMRDRMTLAAVDPATAEPGAEGGGGGGDDSHRAPQDSADSSRPHVEHGQQSASHGKANLRELLGSQNEDGRTWEDWMNLAKSIQGWIEEYETTRVRAGLAYEIGVEPEPQSSTWSVADIDPADFHQTIQGAGLSRVTSQRRADASAQDLSLHPVTSPQQLQVPLMFGSPESPSNHLGRSPSVAGSSFQARMAQRTASETIPECVVRDALNRRHGFRRRAGIPEGLPAGPDGEEFADYTWSRQKLNAKHFATAMTIGSDSLSHIMTQLHESSWVHASAWELDYLEMCVFKSPLVAERFPPPGAAIVPTARSYHPSEGTLDRTKLCPNPDEEGCWNTAEWKRWLATIREGDIIVPAIGWQAWWTLISVLNGADRTGRTYDLQVKTAEEPFEALTDLGAVYI